MRYSLIILFLYFSFTLTGATYYIDPSGADNTSNNGSKAFPWKTLAYACSRVKTSGDIIHINPGTYSETVQSVLSVGVSIEGDGRTTSIINSSISTLNTPTILLLSSSNNTPGNQHISNITLKSNTPYTAFAGIGVQRRGNVEIFNCNISDFNYFGIYMYNNEQSTYFATGNKIHDCTITNSSGYIGSAYPRGDSKGSIDILSQDGLLIYNNVITVNRTDGLNGNCIDAVWGHIKNVKIFNNVLHKTFTPGRTWDFAIEIWSPMGGVEIYNNDIISGIDLSMGDIKGTSSYSSWVHHNRIRHTSLMASEATRGILLESGHNGVIIENNWIENFSSGIMIQQGSGGSGVYNVRDIRISNNIICNVGTVMANSKGWGIYVTPEDYNDSYDNIQIWNNTIHAAQNSYSTVTGIYLVGMRYASNISIRNNIIYGFDTAPIWHTGTRNQTVDVLSIDHNLFYANGNNNNPLFQSITPTHYTSDSPIKTNPQFVSLSIPDFHLQAGSPAIGKGIKVTGITTDYDGSGFNDPPSIGAYEYNSTALPVYKSSIIGNDSPAILEMSYNLNLANIVPAASAFNVKVNSVSRTVNSVSISGTKVLLTLSNPVVSGDVVTVAYTKPSANQLQTSVGAQASTISSQAVTNNIKEASIDNIPPVVLISNPVKGNTYEYSKNLVINVIASDPDGTIKKVELFNGSDKLVELTSSPYTFTWKDLKAGSYTIKAIATDNLNAITTSSPVEFIVNDFSGYDARSEILKLYPNPNDGHFSIEFVNPLQNEDCEVIITDLAGKKVYNEPLLNAETLKRFDISYIKSGIYILSIISKEILIVKKFIKK